jgi:hypothetical protein
VDIKSNPRPPGYETGARLVTALSVVRDLFSSDELEGM